MTGGPLSKNSFKDMLANSKQQTGYENTLKK